MIIITTYYQQSSNKLTTTQIETKMAQALLLNHNFFEFFEILLLSGYHSFPSETDYWSNQIDLCVPL